MYVYVFVGTDDILAESREAEYCGGVEEHRVHTRDSLRTNRLGHVRSR